MSKPTLDRQQPKSLHFKPIAEFEGKSLKKALQEMSEKLATSAKMLLNSYVNSVYKNKREKLYATIWWVSNDNSCFGFLRFHEYVWVYLTICKKDNYKEI